MAGLQGKVFAGYQLAALIGSGGIAEVYRARALNSTREVAVKVISADFARDSAFQERFSRYVQAAQRLGSHPHVLPLLASGVENGSHYIVTPFVRDGTLRDRLRRGFRLGPGDVAPFLRQIANALDDAHKLGIVHGNLKPSNIYLYEGRHILLGDFGLLWDVTKLEMKRKGPGAEAVECFAPEAFAGKLAPASDIYSLGAVLFATLTGRAPFVGKTPGDVYNAHLRQSVPPIEQIDPKVPAPLRALNPVISQAMAKRPDERFLMASYMVQVVETAVQPVGAAARAGIPQGQGRAITGRPVRPMGPLGQLGQLLGAAPAPLGAPLQSLDFPPLPSSEEASGLMDEGHISANLNDPASQPFHPLPGGPGAFPLPGQGQGMMNGAMNGAMNGGAQPFPGQQYAGQYPGQHPGQYPGPFPGQGPQQAYPGAIPGIMPGAIPGAAPQGPLLPPQPGLGPVGAMPGAMAGAMPGGMPGAMPGPFSGPVEPQAQPGYVPGLGPIPLGPIPLGGGLDAPVDSPRAAKGYSATELNLPRLSRVELGPLAPNLERQMNAQMDAAPAAGTQVVAAPMAAEDHPAAPPPDDEEWDESQSYSAVQSAYDDSRESRAMGRPGEWTDEQSAAYAAPRSEWGYTDERSAQMSARRPASHRRRDDWDDDDSAELARSRGRRSRSARDDGARQSSRRGRYDEYDDRYAEDYGRRPASRRRRDAYEDEYGDKDARGGASPWTRGLLLALIPLLLLTLSGVAVMRPDLCPVSACQKISDKVHQLVPALGGGSPGTTAPTSALNASPAQIQLSTTPSTPVSTTFKLANSGTSDVSWQGSTTLSWVTLAPANGTAPAGGTSTVTVTANPSGQAPNTYTTTISIKAGGSTISVPLQITVASS